jgi:hypothetical protein
MRHPEALVRELSVTPRSPDVRNGDLTAPPDVQAGLSGSCEGKKDA